MLIRSKRALALLMGLLLLLAAVTGCGKTNADPQPAETVSPAETETPEAAAEPERQDGERFESVIMIEGMEETVRLEHVRSETFGFEIDYDYERFNRSTEPNRELFLSVYDDPQDPDYYVEIVCSTEDAQTVADAAEAVLSRDYDVIRETRTLDDGSSCIVFDASAVVGGGFTADVLQTVYILPAADGCRVATARYLPDGSDGFGKRISYMLASMTAIDAAQPTALTSEQALAAVKQICLNANPALEGIVSSGEHTVYWDVESESDAEIVVLYRSYTGAEVRYHIARATGETSVTELAPIAGAEEQPTGERFNLWDAVHWWHS